MCLTVYRVIPYIGTQGRDEAAPAILSTKEVETVSPMSAHTPRPKDVDLWVCSEDIEVDLLQLLDKKNLTRHKQSYSFKNRICLNPHIVEYREV